MITDQQLIFLLNPLRSEFWFHMNLKFTLFILEKKNVCPNMDLTYCQFKFLYYINRLFCILF